MKKNYICSIIAIMASTMQIELCAQSVGYNYIKSETMLDSGGTKSVKSVQYYDALGRPDVLLSNSLNPEGKYVCTATEYDMLGRETKTWLPVVGEETPSYIAYSGMPSLSNAIYDDSYAYSTKEYDALGRPTFASTPGQAWTGKGKTIEYITNDRNSVKQYIVNTSGLPTTSSAGYYPSGSLTGERVTDEDGHTIETYKDILGNVVLERRDSNNDTYFVYDRGQLRCVVPPKYQTEQSVYLLYRYEYDAHGRCIKKTLPGCTYIQYWYDKYGRLAFMQDGRMRAEGKYRFYLYDELNRLVLQGIWGEVRNNVNLMSAKAVYLQGIQGFQDTGYSVQSGYTPLNAQLEIVNYYDNYDFVGNNYIATRYFGGADLTNSSHANATSFLTGQILSTSNGEYVCSALYYDGKGNVAEKKEKLLEGTTLSTSTHYTFTDKPDTIVETLTKNGTTRVAVHVNLYNPNTDQLSAHRINYNNSSYVTVASYEYDGIGRVSTVNRHNSWFKDEYQYDLHGWLTKIHSEDTWHGNFLFAESIHYVDGPGTPCYNGNISCTKYETPDYPMGQNIVYGYTYSYDGLDRLTKASYGFGPAGMPYFSGTDMFSEEIGYDANSNITSLVRYGARSNSTGGTFEIIDNLQYGYGRGSNQVRSISDSAPALLTEGAFDFKDNTVSVYSGMPEYSYDQCGSMTYDANKGISLISYDFMGNPKRIQFSNYSNTEYVYAADGRRLKTIHRTAVPKTTSLGVSAQPYELSASETLSKDSTEYLGNFLYVNNYMNRYLFEGGYINGSFTSSGYKYYFRDHLGNNRLVVGTNGIVQQNTKYYPYGGHTHFSTEQGYQKYKYNGKEYDSMHGLNEYDYGARQYDPAIGMFTSMDPLCEKYYHISPYAYCGGNPVSRVDPDGKDWVKDLETGRITYNSELNSRNASQLLDFSKQRYLGANYNDGKKYYSLFGRIMNTNEKRTMLYEHIENALINREKAKNNNDFIDSENFDIGYKYKKDTYDNHYNVYTKNKAGLEYEGGEVRYEVFNSSENMNGYVEKLPIAYDEGKYGQTKGYALIIKQRRSGSSGSTIVRVTFQTKDKRNKFLRNYNKQFGTNYQ